MGEITMEILNRNFSSLSAQTAAYLWTNRHMEDVIEKSSFSSFWHGEKKRKREKSSILFDPSEWAEKQYIGFFLFSHTWAHNIPKPSMANAMLCYICCICIWLTQHNRDRKGINCCLGNHPEGKEGRIISQGKIEFLLLLILLSYTWLRFIWPLNT